MPLDRLLDDLAVAGEIFDEHDLETLVLAGRAAEEIDPGSTARGPMLNHPESRATPTDGKAGAVAREDDRKDDQPADAPSPAGGDNRPQDEPIFEEIDDDTDAIIIAPARRPTSASGGPQSRVMTVRSG